MSQHSHTRTRQHTKQSRGGGECRSAVRSASKKNQKPVKGSTLPPECSLRTMNGCPLSVGFTATSPNTPRAALAVFNGAKSSRLVTHDRATSILRTLPTRPRGPRLQLGQRRRVPDGSSTLTVSHRDCLNRRLGEARMAFPDAAKRFCITGLVALERLRLLRPRGVCV